MNRCHEQTQPAAVQQRFEILDVGYKDVEVNSKQLLVELSLLNRRLFVYNFILTLFSSCVFE